MEQGEPSAHPSEGVDDETVVQELCQFLQPPDEEISQVSSSFHILRRHGPDIKESDLLHPLIFIITACGHRERQV